MSSPVPIMPPATVDRDAIFKRLFSLTWELASLVIEQCIGTPTLSALQDDPDACITLQYIPDMKSSFLPEYFRDEYKWLQRQKWLRSEKTFHDPITFVLAHLACLAERGAFDIEHTLQALSEQQAVLPKVMQPISERNLTGLDIIRLEFPTDVFFSMFKVNVPPFPTQNHLYHDPQLLGAGTYLAHTRELTLAFKHLDPWFDLFMGPWADRDENDDQPCVRPNVCLAGLVVDWILTYAWHHQYLQHIPTITLQGDIQDWVKDKWTQVFAGTHPEQECVASTQIIYEIEHHGAGEAAAAGKPWTPTQYYPPRCQCEINCSRLRDGVVQPEIPATEQEWDLPDIEQGWEKLDTEHEWEDLEW